MHNLINYLWYKAPIIILIPLSPLSLVFFILIFIRKYIFYRYFKRYTSKYKTIVVGNLTVGGSGKTPFTIWLSNFLESKNKKIAVISSGYGSSVSSPTKVTNSSLPQKVGDEAVLIHSKINSIVVSGKNRVKSSIHCDQYDLDYIIHDDGLQHYSLNRDHQLIIINNNFKGNNFVLPCGPYREPKFFHNKKDYIYSNYRENIYPGFYSKITAFKSCNNQQSYNCNDKRFSDSILLTAIADDSIIIHELNEYNINVESHKYPDHYQYKSSDIPVTDKPILISEKDYVKIKLLNCSNIYILEQKIIPNDKLIEMIDNII